MKSCRFWRPLRVLVMVLLVGYFLSKIIDSSSKLQMGEIGVSFEKIQEELVEGGALCYYSNFLATKLADFILLIFLILIWKILFCGS